MSIITSGLLSKIYGEEIDFVYGSILNKKEG